MKKDKAQQKLEAISEHISAKKPFVIIYTEGDSDDPGINILCNKFNLAMLAMATKVIDNAIDEKISDRQKGLN